MMTVYILVVDLVGIDKSRFIYDINDKLVLKKSSENHIKHNSESMPEYPWLTALMCNVGNEIPTYSLNLMFTLAPVLIEGQDTFNTVISFLSGCIFVVENKDSTWNANRDIIQQWQTNLQLPSVVLVQDQEIDEIDIPRLRKGLEFDENIEIFAYKKRLASEVMEVIVAICYAILDKLEGSVNQKNISDTDTSSSDSP